MKGKILHVKDMCFLAEINGRAILLDDGKISITPMQAFLFSLATCTAMDVALILRKKRQDLKKFEVEIEGERRDEYPKIFKKIKINYIFYGNVNEKACKDAIELSMKKYCSVLNMLKEEIKIEYDFKIL